MTEEEWDRCTDPEAMLHYLRGRASDRKLRLFCCACCRHVWDSLTDMRSRSAVETAERYADGSASRGELAAAEQAVEAVAFEEARARAAAMLPVPHVTQAALAAVAEKVDATIWAAWSASEAALGPGEERWHQCTLLRDIFGNPVRPVAIDPAWLVWYGGAAAKLAQAVYDERELPSGHLDASRLAVLADMLEEAGCPDPQLLGHLRGPGPHVRGCFAVDLLLGKS